MEENKFLSTRYDEEPCCQCRNKSKWVSDLTKGTTFNTTTRIRYSPIFKTGDIVVAKNERRAIEGMKNIYIYLYDGWVLRIPYYVIVRSECDYVFSTYTYELINADIATWISIDELEYASHDYITEHDRRAKLYYVAETLNDWFGQLMKRDLQWLYVRRCLVMKGITTMSLSAG